MHRSVGPCSMRSQETSLRYRDDCSALHRLSGGCSASRRGPRSPFHHLPVDRRAHAQPISLDASAIRRPDGERDLLAAEASALESPRFPAFRISTETAELWSGLLLACATSLPRALARSRASPCTSARTVRIVAVSSGSQSPIAKVFATMRVPGFRARKVGHSRRFIEGSLCDPCV
jgi:hypothetical protein